MVDMILSTLLTAAAARVMCEDPMNPDVYMKYARSVSFPGATGQVNWATTNNNRAPGQAVPTFVDLFNWVDMKQNRVQCPSSNNLIDILIFVSISE